MNSNDTTTAAQRLRAVQQRRVVFYSLAVPEGPVRPDLIRQLELSTSSLRRHNRGIEVVLFVYGNLWPEIEKICAGRSIAIHHQGRYEQHLASLCPTGWRSLAEYPTLHRFFNMAMIAERGFEQVLYIDLDTIFFDDVESIFSRYGDADITAREEVHTSRSPYGPDVCFLDEARLAAIAVSERAAFVAPFNLGVMLFSNGACGRIANEVPRIVDYVWRFVTWMAFHPLSHDAPYREFSGVDRARHSATALDQARALSYPSQNRWIVDEVAMWLALGHLDGLTTAAFEPSFVAQNGETLQADLAPPEWVLCHYFSNNLDRIIQWFDASQQQQQQQPQEDHHARQEKPQKDEARRKEEDGNIHRSQAKVESAFIS